MPSWFGWGWDLCKCSFVRGNGEERDKSRYFLKRHRNSTLCNKDCLYQLFNSEMYPVVFSPWNDDREIPVLLESEISNKRQQSCELCLKWSSGSFWCDWRMSTSVWVCLDGIFMQMRQKTQRNSYKKS